MTTALASRHVPDWLSHLRRDRRGLPVPYINRWGPERAENLRLAYDPFVGRRATFYDDAHEAVPDFTAQNPQRQRECMVEGLCQVCHRPVPFSRRCLVVGSFSVELQQVQGRFVPLVMEPWLCHRCAMFATSVCPALIRRKTTEGLTVIPVRSPKQFQMVVSEGWVDDHPDTMTAPVAMWVKVLLLSPAIVTAESLSVTTNGR